MNDHFTNEFHDVAQEEAFDLGFDALHGLAPDEVMMRAEDEQEQGGTENGGMGQNGGMDGSRAKAECLMSVIMAVTFEAASVEVIRDRVAVIAALNAPEMAPRKLWRGQVEFARARAAMVRCPAVAWEPEAGRIMLALMTRKGWSAREVGLRALCFVYAFQSRKSARPALAASLDAIGHAVGLKAENKRSAVSAALKRTALELMQRMQRRDRSHAMAELWFMKREGCRAALSKAMKGKRNRAGKESGHSSILTHSAILAHSSMHDGGTENGGMEELKMGLKAEGRVRGDFNDRSDRSDDDFRTR
jgi:hypothetical protein